MQQQGSLIQQQQQVTAAAAPPLSFVVGVKAAQATSTSLPEAGAASAAAGTPHTGVQTRSSKKRKIVTRISPIALAPEDKTTPPTPDIPSSPACGGIPQTDGAMEEPTTPSEPTASFRSPPPPPPPMTRLSSNPVRVLCRDCSSNHHHIDYDRCIDCHYRRPVPMYI